MKKLSYYLKQHIPGYLFAILSMVIAVSLDLLTPQVTRHIVDDVLVGGQMGKLKYLLLAILLMSAFDLGGVNESAGVLFDSLLAGL